MRRGFSTLVVCGLVAAGCGLTASRTIASQRSHMHQHAAAPVVKSSASVGEESKSSGVSSCGANFVVAMNMVNAAMRAGQNLPASAKVSRAEVDSLFGMAVSIAHRDAPCIRAQLKAPTGFGYDVSYSKMLLAASNYAQSRKLAPLVVLQAREASALLAR